MSSPSITVYSTGPRCQRCKATKRKLDSAGLVEGRDYDYIDVTLPGNEEHRDKAQSYGFPEAPVVVSPTRSWSGFHPDYLQEEIDRLKAEALACEAEGACASCDCGAAE